MMTRTGDKDGLQGLVTGMGNKGDCFDWENCYASILEGCGAARQGARMASEWSG